MIHDLPASPTPITESTASSNTRFHGPEGRYRVSYSNNFLFEYAQNIKAWIMKERQSIFILVIQWEMQLRI